MTTIQDTSHFDKYIELREQLKLLCQSAAKASIQFSKKGPKRQVFLISTSSDKYTDITKKLEELKKFHDEGKGLPGMTKRFAWVPNVLSPRTSQINFTCSPSYSSTKIDRNKAEKIISKHRKRAKLPEHTETFRLIKKTGFDYRAAIVDKDGGRTTQRPYHWIICFYNEGERPIINLPPNRPRKVRSDSRIHTEKTFFSIKNKLWILTD